MCSVADKNATETRITFRSILLPYSLNTKLNNLQQKKLRMNYLHEKLHDFVSDVICIVETVN